MTRHFVPYDQPTGAGGLTRGLCGQAVYPAEQSAQPTCEKCIAILAEEEAQIDGLRQIVSEKNHPLFDLAVGLTRAEAGQKGR